METQRYTHTHTHSRQVHIIYAGWQHCGRERDRGCKSEKKNLERRLEKEGSTTLSSAIRNQYWSEEVRRRQAERRRERTGPRAWTPTLWWPLLCSALTSWPGPLGDSSKGLIPLSGSAADTQIHTLMHTYTFFWPLKNAPFDDIISHFAPVLDVVN